MEKEIKIDKEKLRRTRQPEDNGKKPKEPPAITAGSVDKALDLAFNPSRDKIREVTVVDRIQGRLLPQLDMQELMWQYVIETATYRQDSQNYKKVYEKDMPEPPNIIADFTYRTAQWQKSIGGLNLNKIIDITLAEMETKMQEGDYSGADYFDKDR